MVKRLQVKRIYDKLQATDGYRILVDRLWPRGIKKEDAHIDLWLKDIAPSNELRKWFNHEVEKWLEFKRRYVKELVNKENLINQVLEKLQHQSVTLLYGAKDPKHNQAVVLLEYLGSVQRSDSNV